MLLNRMAMVCGIIALAACTCVANASTLIIGGYDTPLNKSSGIGPDLTNPANSPNFGGASFAFTADGLLARSPGNLTSSYLDGIDIFWSGLPSGGPMSASDAGLLRDFINGGGVVIVNNDRSYPNGFRYFDPLYALLGVAQVDMSTPYETVSVTGSPSAILDGPFGTVTDYVAVDAVRFNSTNPAMDVLLTWANGDAAAGVIGPHGSQLGALVILPDWEATGVNFSCCSDPTESANTLARNAWAYAADVAQVSAQVPLPASLPMLGIAVAGTAFFARRRSKASA